VVEIFLPEIDGDANTGETLQSGFWKVVSNTRIRGGIISEVLDPCRSTEGENARSGLFFNFGGAHPTFPGRIHFPPLAPELFLRTRTKIRTNQAPPAYGDSRR